jgi:hypothetical protein
MHELDTPTIDSEISFCPICAESTIGLRHIEGLVERSALHFGPSSSRSVAGGGGSRFGKDEAEAVEGSSRRTDRP